MVKLIDQIDVRNKRVLVRCDFNVPLKDGQISDDNRIVEALPTIKYLINQGAKVILFSHLGKINFKDEEATEKDKTKNDLRRIVDRLEQLLNCQVRFVGECLDFEIESGEVVLLQNTRYNKGETKNDPELSAKWAELADVYVMDAFGSAHRAHSSTYGVPSILNSTGRQTAVGFLVDKEIKSLAKCVSGDVHPYVAILGGAKVSDKIKVIEKLLNKADKIIIGGAMSYTFLKALGHEIGLSRVEEDQLEFAKKCYESGKIVLPLDHIIADDFSSPTSILTTKGQEIEQGFMGLDIGPKTIEHFKKIVADAKIIFWNGPMGVFENPLFAKGTEKMCEMVSSSSAFTVIGGGDTAAAAKLLGFEKEVFSHVSTGGGASLEMIENDGLLPGIEVIAKQ